MKKIFTILTMLCLLMVPVQVFASDQNVRPIAVQGAMDEEVAYFLKEMGEYKTETFGSYTYYIGQIYSIPVVVSRTEVGMVSAAASTTLLIQKYNPKVIINQGTAGGHDPELHRYDIVVGEKYVNYGKFITNHRDSGSSMAPDTWKVVSTTLRENGEKVKYPYFEPDKELYKVAMSITKNYKYGKAVSGVIGSADEWNRELDRIKWLHENVGTSVEEMEAASAAQVAETFKVPFLGIRILSNSEWYAGEVYEPVTAGNYCAEFVTEVIKEIDSQIVFPIDKVTMVPLRSFMELQGAKVTWDVSKRQVTILYKDLEVSFKPGENEYSVIEKDGMTYVTSEWLEKIFQVKFGPALTKSLT
jgi:adenosylhomocysteine nucleosidase